MDSNFIYKVIIDKMNLLSDSIDKDIIQENVIVLTATNEINSNDETLVIFDWTSGDIVNFDYKNIIEQVDMKYTYYKKIMIFNDWKSEKAIYRKYYKEMKRANDKKAFIDFFNSKFSIYLDSQNSIALNLEDKGINYLENKTKNDEIGSKTYNVSFYELKKIFNVTGTNLFIDNVRYGLSKSKHGKKIRYSFEKYISYEIFCILKSRYDISDELKEDIKEILDYDDNENSYFHGDIFGFCHNGITFFCNTEDSFENPQNQIILKPTQVSVINGAQTLSNFFDIYDEMLSVKLPTILTKITTFKFDAESLIDEAIKNIYVKVSFVVGSNDYVTPIAFGLNSQIPIENEDLLANSKQTAKINEKLKSFKNGFIQIVKAGDIWSADNTISVLEFGKYWKTITEKPGESKNLNKTRLESILKEAEENLDKINFAKLSKVIEVDKWWEFSKKDRKENNKNDMDDVISKYGKNYFEYYVTCCSDEISIDEENMITLYEKFKYDIREIKPNVALEDFKKDELSAELSEKIISRQTNRTTSNIDESLLKELSNNLSESLNGSKRYTRTQIITTFFVSKNIKLPDNIRTVTRNNGKTKESFPFANSTFNELVNCSEEGDINYPPYEQSKLYSEIGKIFSLFVIELKDNKIETIEFFNNVSFKKYSDDAREVYNQTVEAFEKGDEKQFPKLSDNKKFHIRPKAQNGDDTFEFTNGNYITKRTFWVNSSTINDIINNLIETKKRISV